MNPDTSMPPNVGLRQPPAGMGVVSAAPQFGAPSIQAPSAPGPMPPNDFNPPVFASQAPSAMAVPNGQQPVSHVAAIPSPSQEEEHAADTLDAEWVAKAKGIVEHTHTDPYLQSHELSKLKAQFIKARYSKDIKIAEES